MTDTEARRLENEHIDGFLRVLRRAVEIDGHVSLQAISEDGDIDEEWVANPDDLLAIIYRITTQPEATGSLQTTAPLTTDMQCDFDSRSEYDKGGPLPSAPLPNSGGGG